MATRVDPNLDRALTDFGLVHNSVCFNCGLCTAICDLTRGREVFPRKTIRYAQLGLRKRLDESVEPWLCYYCGDCNETCPREARPSDQMMAFRRYLTSVYDWTGLLGRFYTSKRWAFGATAAIALSVIMLFIVLHLLNPGHIPTALAVAPDGTTYVPLNTFAPVEWVHLFDWILAGSLLFLIVTTLYNMRRKMLGGDRTPSIPFWLYITQLWVAPIHFLTQKRMAECGKSESKAWVMHLLLMSGYLTMCVLVVALLPSLQIDMEGMNWTSGPGYYATAALLVACGYFIAARWRKRQALFEQSHFTDWLFISLLAATALTGIACHVFRFYLQWPVATYVTYVLHLAVAVPIYVSPKWAHVVYRPFAMYFASVKRAAEEEVARAVPMPVVVRPQAA